MNNKITTGKAALSLRQRGLNVINKQVIDACAELAIALHSEVHGKRKVYSLCYSDLEQLYDFFARKVDRHTLLGRYIELRINQVRCIAANGSTLLPTDSDREVYAAYREVYAAYEDITRGLELYSVEYTKWQVAREIASNMGWSIGYNIDSDRADRREYAEISGRVYDAALAAII